MSDDPAKATKQPKRTRVWLAKQLGFTPTSVAKWEVKYSSEVPRNEFGMIDYGNVEAWKGLIDRHELGTAPNRMSEDKEELTKEKLRSEIRLNELKIQKEEGRTVLVSEVDERDLQLATLQKSYLYSVLGRELGARGAGKSAEELCVLGQNIADQICDVFTRGVEKWQKSLSD
jgi:hypothetical protein